MSELSGGQEKALKQILLNYANNDNSTTWETLAAIRSVLNCDTGKTLRDEIAMAGLSALEDWMKDRIDTYPEMAKRCYLMADAMLKAREEQ